MQTPGGHGYLMLIREKKIWTPDNSNLLKYREKILSGEIIAGQEMIMELNNLEEDLHHNDEYFYDTEAALLRMDFMEHCIRLTKSPYYGQPMVLLDFQKAFIESFVDKLESYYPEVRYVNRLMTHSWGQKVIRFYDPDGNLIEVGTPV